MDKNSLGARREGAADRLMAGGNLKNFNKKYLEKHLKTNSALRDHADEIRSAYAKAHGEGAAEEEPRPSTFKNLNKEHMEKHLKTKSALVRDTNATEAAR